MSHQDQQTERFKQRRKDGVPLVFLALPHYDGRVCLHSAVSWLSTAVTDDSMDTIPQDDGGSLLARVFNRLWCLALNWNEKNPEQIITHFGMLHADLIVSPNWLPILWAEMKATDADLVSVVVPIKNEDGLTSTAISSTDRFRVERRLTMKEVMRLPETFDAEACGYPGETILANTGCWLARFDRLWKYDVHFEINDRIRKDPSGQYIAETEPEDWNFSRQIWKHGGKIVATRKVIANHIGIKSFPNDQAWGDLDIDYMANGRKLPVFEA